MEVFDYIKPKSTDISPTAESLVERTSDNQKNELVNADSESDLSNELSNKTSNESSKDNVDNRAKVLQNQSESDTIKSSTESNPVEREDNGNESIRENLPYENGRWGNDESAGKYGRDILSDRREKQSKSATERQNFARELTDRGQTEDVTIENNKVRLIKYEAYSEDMLSLVEKAKNKGVKLRFFAGTGTATIIGKDGTQWQKSIDGVKINSKEIYVQYDANRAPETLYRHETSHAKWQTAEMQKAKDTILNSLKSYLL